MFEFQLKPHPARVEVHGKLVPLIDDVQTIYVKDEELGRFIQCGYCGKEPGRPVTLTRHYPEIFVRAVEAFVNKEVGKPKAVAVPPEELSTDGDD